MNMDDMEEGIRASQTAPSPVPFSLGPETEAYSIPLDNGNKLTILFRNRAITQDDKVRIRAYMDMTLDALLNVMSKPTPNEVMRIVQPKDSFIVSQGHVIETRERALNSRRK